MICTSVVQENFQQGWKLHVYPALLVATCHLELLNTWNVASIIEELSFKLYLIFIILKFN